jgi:endonuclease/exonuclease/phosphatase family metal-dependent hydrolase
MTIIGAPMTSPLNEFQRSLKHDRIYRKGDTVPLQAAPEASSIRLLTWNIAGGVHPEQIAKAIAAFRPDIVCLQEVDWGNERTGGRDVLEVLVREVGMLGFYAIEFFELASPDRARRLAGGGTTGNALLTRIRPEATFRIELPAALDWTNGSTDRRLAWRVRKRLRREPRLGHRCGIAAEFKVNGARFVVCSTHLEDKQGGVSGRWAQYVTLSEAIDNRRNPADLAIIAGDLNTLDCRRTRLITGDGAASALGKPASRDEAAWWKEVLLPQLGYRDPYAAAQATFAIPLVFRTKLDWIVLKGGSVLDCGVGCSSLSDHRLLWCEIRVNDRHQFHPDQASPDAARAISSI